MPPGGYCRPLRRGSPPGQRCKGPHPGLSCIMHIRYGITTSVTGACNVVPCTAVCDFVVFRRMLTRVFERAGAEAE